MIRFLLDIKFILLILSNLNSSHSPKTLSNTLSNSFSNFSINFKGYKQSRKFFKKRILYGFNKYQEKLSQSGFIHGYLCDKNNSLLTWEHIDDPRHPFFYKDEEYYKIRSMNEKNIIKWYKRDAEELLENYTK